MPHPQSSGFKKPTIRPFKQGIVVVFVLFLVLSKIDEIRNQYLRCAIASAHNCISAPYNPPSDSLISRVLSLDELKATLILSTYIA